MSSRSTTRKMPRRILIGVGAMAAAMAVASLAYACTVITGFTWYASGSPSSGPTGTNITAFATEARANRSFKLVVGNTNTPGHEDHACMDNVTDINSNVRISSSSGFIGNTSGPINKPAGTWQVCFYEVTAGAVGASATFPVSFTVV